MTVPGNLSSPLLATAAGGAAAVGPTRSLRFNSGDSARLSRTPSAGNRRTFTWAGWVKRSSFGSRQHVFGAVSSGSSFGSFEFNGDDELRFYDNTLGDSNAIVFETTRVFRDPSAWYHIVVALDSTAGTNAERIKLYVNGVQETSFSTGPTVASNGEGLTNSTAGHNIGSWTPASSSLNLNAYLADVYFVDGSQLSPTSFGAFDDNGVWQAADYSGTFGTNGFHLDFADGSDLGDDNSGNGNDFTPNNFSAFDGSVAAANGALPILNTTGTYGGTVGSGTRTDSSSSSIVLALPLNGANNGTTWSDQSATIKGSGSAKTITANNDAKTSTAESFFYGSSTYFDGNGDRLVLTNASDLSFTGDFTVETWLYISDSTTTSYPNGDRQIVGVWSGSNNDWLMTYSGTGSHNTFLFQMHTGGSTVFFSSGVDMSNYVGQWVHLATVRSSNSIQNYVNGVASGSAYSNSASFGQSSNVAVGGRVGSDGNSVKGYLSDLRIYLSAKYTGNFDVPSRTGNSGCDSLFDVPTNGSQSDGGNGGEVSGNYATLNPLDSGSGVTLSNGNLQFSSSGSSQTVREAQGTIAMPASGKYYFEVTVGTVGEINIGLKNKVSGNLSVYYRYNANNFNNVYIDGSNNNRIDSYTDGDVIGVAYDSDDQEIRFYKNGTALGSEYSLTNNGQLVPHVSHGSSSGSASGHINFGARAFSYAAPSGYKCLNSASLPTPTIADGSDHFDIQTYTGTGASRTLGGLSFAADLFWRKCRSTNQFHNLVDSVRGLSSALITNGTFTEQTGQSNVSNVTSTGYDIGTEGAINTNGETYVAWLWDAGSSTVSNTDGSITSQVRANPSAGFSIVSWTSSSNSGAFDSIGHGLNALPGLVITKRVGSIADSWYLAHSFDLTKFGTLDTTNAFANASNGWGNGHTSSVIGMRVGSFCNPSEALIAYCFAPVAGYSAFGSYTGNGSSDGPFVHTGFRPALIITKRTDSSGGWVLWDTARNISNVATEELYPDDPSAEYTGGGIDILSNGFKLRNSSAHENNSGASYIYWAVAENPFQANGGLAR